MEEVTSEKHQEYHMLEEVCMWIVLKRKEINQYYGINAETSTMGKLKEENLDVLGVYKKDTMLRQLSVIPPL